MAPDLGGQRIAVDGAGGVGGHFEGRLAQAGTDVHFIDRGTHLQALRTHGLRVQSVKGDFAVQVPATDDPAEVGPLRRRAGLRQGLRPGRGHLHLRRQEFA